MRYGLPDPKSALLRLTEIAAEHQTAIDNIDLQINELPEIREQRERRERQQRDDAQLIEQHDRHLAELAAIQI